MATMSLVCLSRFTPPLESGICSSTAEVESAFPQDKHACPQPLTLGRFAAHEQRAIYGV